MGRDVGGHTHGDAGGAVDQQIGEPAGQYPGFFPAFIEVGIPVHRILVDVPEHFVGNFGKPCLGIPVGRGGIAVHGTEVAVAVYQQVAHGKILGKSDHGIVNGSVAMGVVLTQHVTHAGGALLKGLVGGQAAFVHGVQNPAVYGFQTVPHVRQGSAHNDAHGVLNIGPLHLLHQMGFGNHLVGKRNVLGFIRTVMCHKAPPYIFPRER